MPTFLDLSRRLSYYKRRDVQESLVQHAVDKEVAVKFGDAGFGKRPEVLRYPTDVLEFVKSGASSFHCSEELWKNPVDIKTGATKEEISELRKGWDLVLDVDCPILEFSGIATDFLIKALKHYDITQIDTKFSGNHGFHVGVPFKAFPERVNDVEIKDWFPEGPRNIAGLLQGMINTHTSARILEGYTTKKVSEITGLEIEKVWNGSTLMVQNFVKIDTVLIAPRHLYRMPYSMNEKSGLVSAPIEIKELTDFDKTRYSPEKIAVEKGFLINTKNDPGEARKLFIQAIDYASQKKQEEQEISKTRMKIKNEGNQKQEFTATEAITPELFPPCMKIILEGVSDGRKRALFCLTNFLKSVGWSQENMERFVREWNQKNKPPLSTTIIEGQLRISSTKNAILPPNCDNKAYYLDFHVCKPDSFCSKIKNPANYSILKWKILKERKISEKEDKIDKIEVR